MFGRSVDYFTSLAVLVALAVLYQTASDHLLTPTEIASVPMAERASLRPDESLANLFPDAAWQRGSCMQLQTRDAVLLFDEVTPQEGNRWTFSPVTFVYGRGMESDPSSKPLILEADKAELEFASSLDLDSVGPEAPMIQRGNLVGSVRIRSVRSEFVHTDPSQSPMDHDAIGEDVGAEIDIQTSNVGIDKRHLWTTQELRMRFGKAILVGRDLSLDLVAASGRSTETAKNIVDEMTLTYLDELTVPLENEANSWVEVECGGLVKYDFGIDLLQLNDSVTFVHKTPGLPDDRFDCNRLEIHLRDPFNSDLPRVAPLDWIDEIHALGVLDEPVLVRMPSQVLELAANALRMKVQEGELRAIGREDDSSGRRQPVSVRYGDVFAHLENMVYRFDPHQPSRFGQLSVDGSGVIQLRDERFPLHRLSWNQMLEIQPLDDRPLLPSSTVVDSRQGKSVHGQNDNQSELPQRLRVNVDGQVNASFVDGGTFHAEYVQCDMKSMSDPEKQSPPFATRLDQVGSSKEATQWSIMPTAFVAKQNVWLDMPSLQARTEELALLFSMGSNVGDRSNAGKSGESTSSARTNWISKNQDETNDPKADPRHRPVMEGRRVGANLVIQDGELFANDLSVDGDVRMKHWVDVGGQWLETMLRGSQLRLIQKQGQEVLQLSSRPEDPARLDLGDGYFIGPTIQVRPSDNLVEINEAGEFRVPTAMLPQSEGTQSKIEWIDPPVCHWNGSMRFDGQHVVLDGGVNLDATVRQALQRWELELRGETLTVTLDQMVELRKAAEMRRASLARLAVTHQQGRPVNLEARGYSQTGQLKSRHVLLTPEIILLPDDGGRVIGQGPGSYWVWNRGQMQSPLDSKKSDPTKRPKNTREAVALLAEQRNQQSRMLESSEINGASSKEPLTGMHLTFYEKFVGLLPERQLEFLRNVRIGVRPVRDWDDAVDVTAMNQLKNEELTVLCERLRVAMDPTHAATREANGRLNRYGAIPQVNDQTQWEMLADGGVVLKNQREEGFFELQAGEATYHSGKDALTLRGGANRWGKLSVVSPERGTSQATFDVLDLMNIRSGELQISGGFHGLRYGQQSSGATGVRTR